MAGKVYLLTRCGVRVAGYEVRLAGFAVRVASWRFALREVGCEVWSSDCSAARRVTRNSQLATRSHLTHMADGGDFVVEFAFSLHPFLLVRQPAFFF